jgi:hypothetical protein
MTAEWWQEEGSVAAGRREPRATTDDGTEPVGAWLPWVARRRTENDAELSEREKKQRE